MNKNPKEKYTRIEVRVKPKDKEKIKQIANKCGLSVSEFVMQRALGCAPKAVQPDVFFDFYNKLCELLNSDLSPETEAAALKLFDDIYAKIIDAKKQSMREIIWEMKHTRSGKPFDTCDENDERSVLAKADKQLLCENTAEKHFDRSQPVHDNMGCTGLFIVRSGRLRLYMLSEDGKEVTLYRLSPGDICMLSAS